MSALDDLITAVERAEGPSREIDVNVWVEFGNDCDDPEGDVDSGIPQWTASIDAVVALIRREMPGAWFEIAGCEDSWSATVSFEFSYLGFEDEVVYDRKRAMCDAARTPALALLLAFLRAARARQENDTP